VVDIKRLDQRQVEQGMTAIGTLFFAFHTIGMGRFHPIKSSIGLGYQGFVFFKIWCEV
jgi:hypothetical protein